MTDKELLEEIIENVEEIMETPYVVRKEKAIEVGIKLIMTGKVDFLLRKIDSLEEQNKRYREAIEKARRELETCARSAYFTLSKTLEGESK